MLFSPSNTVVVEWQFVQEDADYRLIRPSEIESAIRLIPIPYTGSLPAAVNILSFIRPQNLDLLGRRWGSGCIAKAEADAGVEAGYQKFKRP